MIHLAANLSFLFAELPFLDRFEAAARAGFTAVELAFPYDVGSSEIAVRLREFGLRLVLINTPPGTLEAGEMGLATLPGRQAAAEAAFRRALEYAEVLDVPRIHVLAGNRLPDADPGAVDRIFLRNVVQAADLAAASGREITLEPLNARDRPDYHLQSNWHARRLIEASGCKNVKLQLDLYHCRFLEDDLVAAIDRTIDILAHVQIANFPDRREPTAQGIDFPRLLAHLEKVGYAGYVGCEYIPAANTLSGLGWARPYLAGSRK